MQSSRMHTTSSLAPRSPFIRLLSSVRPGRCALRQRVGVTAATEEPQSSGAGTPAPAPERPAVKNEPRDSLPLNGTVSNSDEDELTRPEDRRPKRKKTQASSTDPISTFLTRRFGLAGGLGWLVLLAIGSLGEQIKTRMEVATEEAGQYDVAAADQKDVLLSPGGVTVRDLRVGGGQSPGRGMLVILEYVGKANGVVFEDTRARGKPIVFIAGGRPFTGGLCAGAEQALLGMKAGGRRIAIVPPELGFKDGTVLRPTEHVPDKQGNIPAGAVLEYDFELLRVSVPPT